MITIEIDENSGFCFGVVNAINKAEKELEKGKLYCIGDIVHNTLEVERLQKKGLITIGHEKFGELRNCRVLFRAHGEPPSSYCTAKQRGIDVIDASCPVVLGLQKKIREAYEEIKNSGGQVVIYGKKGHSEVVGLVGQTNGEAIVVDNEEDIERIDFTKPVIVFSQTTKNLEHFQSISEKIRRRGGENVKVYDTICRKVANRIPQLRDFAARHDVILFVSDEKSSNGRQLYVICKEVNERSYFIHGREDLKKEMFDKAKSVGISGATSTPHRIMKDVAQEILNITK
ncbi:MAG: 4-hydroxy-3-methylbut-2-enyl diphosphate reductase [Culturomica sp.]|nr:4-hydroxy-3-methylbut-2-enyl diphosphate reductase [Culturomica sp.]